jgi:hypothetical protein
MYACNHILLSGNNQGNYCNKRKYLSYNYCKKHYKRYINENQLEEKIDENELFYEKCNLCHNKLIKPLITLECKCQFHLSCYSFICINNDTCFNCNDKIYKTEEDYDSCPICLEKLFLYEDKHIITKCNHTFHKKCITTWIIKKSNCPICRKNINNNILF